MMARSRTDLPVPAEPVKKKFSPLTTRSRMSSWEGDKAGPLDGWGGRKGEEEEGEPSRGAAVAGIEGGGT